MTIQELQEKGFQCGSRHIRCLGRIQLPGDGHWENTPDICGWYENFAGGFTAFVTDEERGLIKSAMEYKTEGEAVEGLIRFVEREEFIALKREMLDGLDQSKHLLLSWIKQQYGYDDKKADEALAYLMQKEIVIFEFAYYVRYMKFVPDKFAFWIGGWTAEKIYQTMDQTVLGAFNYMVYLSRNKKEALENLEKNLPRR